MKIQSTKKVSLDNFKQNILAQPKAVKGGTDTADIIVEDLQVG